MLCIFLSSVDASRVTPAAIKSLRRKARSQQLHRLGSQYLTMLWLTAGGERAPPRLFGKTSHSKGGIYPSLFSLHMPPGGEAGPKCCDPSFFGLCGGPGP